MMVRSENSSTTKSYNSSRKKCFFFFFNSVFYKFTTKTSTSKHVHVSGTSASSSCTGPGDSLHKPPARNGSIGGSKPDGSRWLEGSLEKRVNAQNTGNKLNNTLHK